MENEHAAAPAADSRYLIVGLGNPGRKYAFNRHNVGFMTVDRLAARHGIELKRAQSRAIIGTGRIGNRAVVLAKPQTFMNLSGEAVGALLHYYRIAPEALLVIYDELDIPFGTLRLREKGGAGGHNGMRSIIQHLGNEFPRLRLGIGRPPGQLDPAAFVLQDFRQTELPVVSEMLDTAIDAVETFVADGIQMAMSRFNRAAEEPASDQSPS